MKKIIPVTLVLVLILSGWACFKTFAADTGTVFGQGAIPCKKFLKASERKKNDYVIWIQGYLTAYNAIAPDIINVLSGKDFHWVLKKTEEICKSMPEEYFNEAVVQMVMELHPQGIRIAPPSTGMKNP